MTDSEIHQKIAAFRERYRNRMKPDSAFWVSMVENQINEIRELRREVKLLKLQNEEPSGMRSIGRGQAFIRWDPSFGFTLNLWFGFVHYCAQHGLVFTKKYKF